MSNSLKLKKCRKMVKTHTIAHHSEMSSLTDGFSENNESTSLVTIEDDVRINLQPHYHANLVDNSLDDNFFGITEEKVATNKPLKKIKSMVAEYKDKERKNPSLPYYIENNYIMKAPKTNEEDPKTICRYLILENIHRDLDVGTIKLNISFDYKGKKCSKEIARSMLTKKNILSLIEYGVDVMDDSAALKNILYYLQHEEKEAPMISSHTQIGFGELDGQLIYKLYGALGCESIYAGALDIEPRGSIEGWYETIRQHVVGHTPLEFALVMGLTAPVAVILIKAIALEVLLVHICGDSSMGKTIASSLAVSPFGSPNPKANGLVQTWNATDNAIFGFLRNIHGVPLVLDEASIKGSGDFSSMIYTVAGGKEKGRLNSDGKMCPQDGWSGLFISNAEHSLKCNSKKNVGLQIRLTEFSNVKWTDSAAHADAVKEGIMANYGQVGLVFVKYLLEVGIEEVVRMHKIWKNAFQNKIVNSDRFASRIADKMAIFLVTAELANQALDVNFDINNIMEFLLKSVSGNGENRDLGVKAYQYFQEAVIRYSNNFFKNTEEKYGYECWGKVTRDEQKKLKEIAVLPEIFKKVMKEGGFEDSEIILNDWRNRKWLSCDKDKYTRKRVIVPGEEEVRVYVILQDNKIDSEDDTKVNSCDTVLE